MRQYRVVDDSPLPLTISPQGDTERSVDFRPPSWERADRRLPAGARRMDPAVLDAFRDHGTSSSSPIGSPS